MIRRSGGGVNSRRRTTTDRDSTTTSPSRREHVGPDAARCELELPARAEAPGGQPERDLLEMRVEEQEERLVAQLLPVRRLGVELLAVQEDADRARTGVVPVATRHPPAVGAHPPHVGELLAVPSEEACAPEHRMRRRELDQPPR